MSLRDIIGRIARKCRTAALRGKFKSFGKGAHVGKYENLLGMEYISVGERTGFADGVTLTAWDEFDGKRYSPEIIIGARRMIVGSFLLPYSLINI